MKNILKRNSRKVNVSDCGTLDCYEKQTEKEVEIYKPISEDTTPKEDSIEFKSDNREEQSLPSSKENVVVLKEPNSLTDTKMVQEDSTVNDGADEQMLGADDNDKLAAKHDEVKFIKGDHQNGDAKIDIGAVNGKAFTGMTKEELMKYANDPFWVRLRWIFFIAFWLIWLAMLVGAILIIIGAPKCAAPEPLPWYKRGLLAKFSNFEVTNENVALAADIKASGVIYEMPAELTYNIREPEVEEKIRDMVIKHSKDRNTFVILDITPNYVPKTSRLMKEALEDKTKRSAFIWKESPEVPNNWLSLINGSAWSEVMSGNYVLSQFGDNLYDLNMNDSIVRKELNDVLQHAVNLGVRGIRMKNSKFFILTKKLKDEVPTETTNFDLTQYGFWTHTQTTFQEGLGDVLYEYQTVVKKASDEAFLSVADDVMRPDIYKTSSGVMGIDIPLYGQFVKSLASPKGKNLRSELMNVRHGVGDKWTQWNLADLNNNSEADPSAITLFLSLLPGTPVVPMMGSSSYANLSKATYDKIEKLRLSPSYMHGDFATLPVDPLVAFTRIKSGNPGYLVAFNPTDINQVGNFTDQGLPDKMTVVAVSDNFNVTNIAPKIVINLADLEVSPLATLVLTYVPVKAE